MVMSLLHGTEVYTQKTQFHHLLPSSKRLQAAVFGMLLCDSLPELQRLCRCAQKAVVRHHCKQRAQEEAAAAAAQLDQLPQAAPATIAARAALERLSGKGVRFESLSALQRCVAAVQDAVRAAQRGVVPTSSPLEESAAEEEPSAHSILRHALEDARHCITPWRCCVRCVFYTQCSSSWKLALF
jgi:hypothetical protein